MKLVDWKCSLTHRKKRGRKVSSNETKRQAVLWNEISAVTNDKSLYRIKKTEPIDVSFLTYNLTRYIIRSFHVTCLVHYNYLRSMVRVVATRGFTKLIYQMDKMTYLAKMCPRGPQHRAFLGTVLTSLKLGLSKQYMHKLNQGTGI